MIKARDKQILTNMASSWGAFAVSAAIFFFLTPYMRQNLGDGTMGIWYLLGSLLSYVGWMKSGLVSALTKHVAEYQVRNNHENLLVAIHSTFVMNLVSSLLVLGIGISLFFLADQIPAIQKTSLPGQARFALLLVVIFFALQLPLTTITATIAGLQRYDFNSLMQTIGTLLQALGFVFVIHFGYGLVGLALCQIAVMVIVSLVSLGFLKSIYPFRFSLRWVRMGMIRDLFRFSFYGTLLNIGHYLSSQIAPILIGFLLNDAAIFCYVIGVKLLDLLETITGEALRVLLPVASEISVLRGPEKDTKILELMIRGSRFSVLLSLPVILFMGVFGESFISAWQGISYHRSRESYLIFLILALPYLARIAQQITGPLMIGLNVHKVFSILWILLSGLNLVLSLVLGKIAGILGIAAGGALSFLILLFIGQFILKAVLHISMWRYYRQAWFHLAWIGAGWGGILLLIKSLWTPASLPAILGLGGLTVASFWIAGFWVLDNYEKKVVRTILYSVLNLNKKA